MDGTPFGRYRLVELLGRGGMGEVWRAYDTGTHRVVALKVLPPDFAQDPVFAERFRREAHAAAQLNNAHVISIHNYGEIDGRLFVDMRLIDGHDLQAELDRGPIDPARAVRIVEQIATALNAAHRIGLIHRDVKPSNILLDVDDLAYLIDFGIARAATDRGLTGTGTTIGTWAYMAPERFSTDLIDGRTDVYALTCVLHQCLTGIEPFPGGSFEQIATGHMFNPPPRPSQQNPGIPTAFDDVIAIGMAKNPNHRYPSTNDLAAAARNALTAPHAWIAPTTTVRSQPTRPTPVPAPHPGYPTLPPPHLTPYGQPQHWPSGPPGPHPHPSQGSSWPRKAVLIPTALAVVVAVAAAAILLTGRDNTTADGTTTSKPGTLTSLTPLAKPRSYGSQQTLPFPNLGLPTEVAVGDTGTVYVIDLQNRTDAVEHRVFALAAGSPTSTALPFTDLSYPFGVAVDGAGTVYIADKDNQRVLALDAGSSTPKTLVDGVSFPSGVAVDGAGTVYVTSSSGVLSFAAGSNKRTELPFTELNNAGPIAVDAAGTVYVADLKNRVFSLAAGSTEQIQLPFTGLDSVGGVAVDGSGTVYVVDTGGNRVLALDPGSTTPSPLPFTDLGAPFGVAVDGAGNVYVASSRHVLKLPVA